MYYFSTGGKFHPDYGLLLELCALTLVACSYALLVRVQDTAAVMITILHVFCATVREALPLVLYPGSPC